MTRYALRRAIAEDERSIAHLHKSAIGDDNVPSLAVGAWWIAETDAGAFAGFCGIHPSVQSWRAGYLIRAAVHPDHRGNGLQKRMIRARLSYARRAGWTRAVTYTLADNAPSANSLIACGFRVFVPRYEWAGSSVIYWLRTL